VPIVNVQEQVPPGDYIEYKVQSGDSLYKIATKYGLSVDEVKNYNNLTSELLSIGQIIKIPIISTVTTYTVKSGDSLYQIANLYNTTVDEIKRKNNLTSNTLSIGQILIL
jgi:LysM repeat protein